MNDPIGGRLEFGFSVCALALFIWASIDYSRFIKFWMIRPAPYTRCVAIMFRVFFLACVLGASWQVLETAIDSRRPAMFYLSALPVAVCFFCVCFLMINAVERMHRKRMTKK